MIQLIAGCMANHSTIFEDEDGAQDVISPYSLNQFSISNTPWTVKRVKIAKKSNDSRIVVSRQFDFTWKSKGKVSVAKNIEFIEEKRRNRRINGRIATNGQDCASFGESMRLSCECPIGDGASTVSHIARVKRCVDSSHPLYLHRCVMMSPRVAARLIV